MALRTVEPTGVANSRINALLHVSSACSLESQYRRLSSVCKCGAAFGFAPFWVELCCDLVNGGTTPSIGAVRIVRS
eukprot:3342414-Amphidinium_carterae.1